MKDPITEDTYAGALCHQLKLNDIMSKPVVIYEGAGFSMVEQKFIDHRIRHLPVVDDTNRLVGVISQRDVYRTISPRTTADDKVYYVREPIAESDDVYYDRQVLDDYILTSVMHKSPSVLGPDDSVEDAIHLMVAEKIGCVPIVNERYEPIGIVTRFDILKTLDEVLQNTADG